MPFGVLGAPSILMRIMNQVFRLCICKFVAVYFNDVLIYSNNEPYHQDRLTQVMLVLEHERLFRNLKKCALFNHEVTFLGYIITRDGIKADESNIEAI